jgi:NADH-quinone oxidoreductase subunit N
VNMGDALKAMMPEHILLAGIIVLIVLEIAGKGRSVALLVSIVFAAAAASAAFWLASTGYAAAPFAGQFSVTPQAFVTKGVMIALVLPVLAMSRAEFSEGEFPILVLSSLYGVSLLPSSDSFLTMFLAIELMSLPVYALVLLAYRRSANAEAALKYLVLSGTASAMFLMGASLLYGAGGSMSVDSVAQAMGSADTMTRVALVLILLSLFLKAAVVPFHAWAPDAYEGASMSVTAYMATIIKGGVLLAALRLFDGVNVSQPLTGLLFVLPLLSIVWGNLAAIRQQSFRRLIAYSSIAHAGYLFYAFLGDADGRNEAVLFYIVAYALVNLLAFAVLPNGADDVERDRLDGLRGLFQRDPIAALLIGIAMLSLAGIPPFPGFVAKFLIFRSVMEAGYATYAVVGLIASYLGIYFYLRVILLMFMTAREEQGSAITSGRADGLARSAAYLCVVATVVMLVVPGWVLGRV